MKFLFLLSVWICHTAIAGEAYFGRVYTTETVPAKHFELEQIARGRFNRAFGSYQALDLRTEFEYGLTDDLQASLYLNTGYLNANGSPDDDDANGATGFTRNLWYLEGVSTEFIYRTMSPFTDGIGLAFYIEPEVLFHDLHNGLEYDLTFSNEFRILVQKNFMDDQLVLAYNFVTEFEFVRFKGQEVYRGELDWNHELGATYRFLPNWYGGLEVRNHNEIGNFRVHEHSVLWAGPTVHFGAANLWATLSVMKQIWGGPSGTDSNGTFIGNNLFLRSHEDLEITAKVGMPF